MFSPKIVGSDDFIDMPTSSRELYFQLGMYADDDGFISPRKIMRMVGASEDDLKVLLTKRFLLPFENGVVVIKHWPVNNLVRRDWYQETIYKEQKKTLRINNENGSYTDSKDASLTSSLTVRQHRIGKDSLDHKEKESPLSERFGDNAERKKTDLKKDLKKEKTEIPFTQFWDLYPKKAEKKKTEAKWDRLSKSVQEKILEDLPKRKESEAWKKGFILNPMTYLNGERWEDELGIAKSEKAQRLEKFGIL
jgi:hypothetical protein